MKTPFKALGIIAIFPIVACTPVPDDTGVVTVQRTIEGPGRAVQISEDVQRVARPDQDLSTVRLFPDGCYWWLYEGVVEDTFIPLETRDSRPICARGRGTPISEL